MCEKLKSDYLKNKKIFQIEIKTFFLVSKVLFFRNIKQTSKNVVDKIFNSWGATYLNSAE